MATPNTVLTNALWVDDGQGSPLRIITNPSSKLPQQQAGVAMITTTAPALSDDLIKFYKDHGFESAAQEGGTVIDAHDTIKQEHPVPTKAIQYMAVPVISSPGKSPFKIETLNRTRMPTSPIVISNPQRVYRTAQVVSTSPRVGGAQIITTAPTIAIESPQQWQSQGQKRPQEVDPEFAENYIKRMKKNDKGGKGLRHFSMKVCEKVQKKGITSYNEVADELVSEFSDPRTDSPSDQQYDQKNIRRRVYDALNVLMAMNIISKEKKEIRWIGLPTNSAQECQNLELEMQKKLERIKHKTQHLKELILQQIAFRNLVQRNKQLEQSQGQPIANSAIQLPFIIVNTSKKTVIDCRISNDKYEYLFKFDNTFEIHDDIEVLKRMGMAFGLDKGICSQKDLTKAMKMVPQALSPYVQELASTKSSKLASLLNPHSPYTSQGDSAQLTSIPASLSLPGTSTEQSADAEVALVTATAALSRQSSIGSFSDAVHSRETPSDPYSDASDSERSSSVDVS